jgi:hypothetical protein
MDNNKSKDRPGLEAIFESAEAVVDVAMEGDLLASIPIVGLAFKFVKAADSLRDRALAEKLKRFSNELDAIPQSERDKYKERLVQDPGESRKVGETLFLVLEHLTDLDKPALLAAVFVSYLGGIISSTTLRRLSQAIDVAFADDLRALVTAKRPPKDSQELWMQYLASAGLTAVRAGNTYVSVGQVYYEVAPLGHTLRDAYYYHARAKRKA